MKPKHFPWDYPDVILLLGTDAAGKDHVANLLVEMIRESGGEVEKRKRFFSGEQSEAASSEKKSFFDTLQEKGFLLLFERLGFMLPFLMSCIIRWDLKRFQPPEHEKKLVVVGHNALRAMAFHMGQRYWDSSHQKLPRHLRSALKKMKRETGAHVIVLDVEDHIRKARINARLANGSEDTFDKYMHSDGERSERIEASLVNLARTQLGATLIENNDLSGEELRAAIKADFSAAIS